MVAIKRTRSYVAKPNELNPRWHLFDASVVPLGRMAGEIATILQGKHRPTYTATINTGDFVVVVNLLTKVYILSTSVVGLHQVRLLKYLEKHLHHFGIRMLKIMHSSILSLVVEFLLNAMSVGQIGKIFFHLKYLEKMDT